MEIVSKSSEAYGKAVSLLNKGKEVPEFLMESMGGDSRYSYQLIKLCVEKQRYMSFDEYMERVGCDAVKARYLIEFCISNNIPIFSEKLLECVSKSSYHSCRLIEFIIKNNKKDKEKFQDY